MATFANKNCAKYSDTSATTVFTLLILLMEPVQVVSFVLMTIIYMKDKNLRGWGRLSAVFNELLYQKDLM